MKLCRLRVSTLHDKCFKVEHAVGFIELITASNYKVGVKTV